MTQIRHIALLFITSSLFAQERALYSMDDLRILAKERNDQEFLSHALDIRPSSRNDEWKSLTEAMAKQAMERLIQSKAINEEEFQFIEGLNQWPLFRSLEPFQRRRATIGGLYFEYCADAQQKSEWKACLNKMKNFWSSLPSYESLALKLGETTLNMIPPSQGPPFAKAWFFYKIVAFSDYAEFYCKDRSFKSAARSMIVRETSNSSRHFLLEKRLKNLFNPNCWAHIAKDLVVLIENGSEGWQSFLAALSAWPATELPSLGHLYVLYLLNAPKEGDTLTHSWQQLKLLGRRPKERSKILGYLKTLDPLPGKLFQEKEKDQSRFLISQLASYFPEYLDFYARTCLSFREESQEFPQGDPTPHCDAFFHTSEKREWIAPGLHSRYKKVSSPTQNL